MPGETANLAISANGVTMNWTPAAGASAYDLLKGDLTAINGTGGDFAGSVTACLEDNSLDFKAFDFATPAPGEGFYYLVRGVGVCSLPGTYDYTDPSQSGGRDASISASPATCP